MFAAFVLLRHGAFPTRQGTLHDLFQNAPDMHCYRGTPSPQMLATNWSRRMGALGPAAAHFNGMPTSTAASTRMEALELRNRSHVALQCAK